MRTTILKVREREGEGGREERNKGREGEKGKRLRGRRRIEPHLMSSARTYEIVLCECAFSVHDDLEHL
jgi:hypothetical protein